MATTANTTGINTAGIGKIKDALANYKKAVAAKCNIDASKLVASAIKGTNSEATLKAMILAIDTKMKQYINQIDQYDELLDSMKTAYTNNDTNNTSFSEVSKNLSGE